MEQSEAAGEMDSLGSDGLKISDYSDIFFAAVELLIQQKWRRWRSAHRLEGSLYCMFIYLFIKPFRSFPECSEIKL